MLPDTDRDYLALLFRDMGYTVGAEIGTGGGVFAELLFRRIPELKLYCIDAWETYPGNIDFTDQKYLDIDYQNAQARLAPHHAIIKRAMSMDAVSMFADGSLDFVYIDANHETPWVYDDVREWSKKVRPGGMVSGHDYIYTHDHVVKAVDQYCERPLFLVGKWGEYGRLDLICSWFWVKA